MSTKEIEKVADEKYALLVSRVAELEKALEIIAGKHGCKFEDLRISVGRFREALLLWPWPKVEIANSALSKEAPKVKDLNE